jgi:hypothetical protein
MPSPKSGEGSAKKTTTSATNDNETTEATEDRDGQALLALVVTKQG